MFEHTGPRKMLEPLPIYGRPPLYLGRYVFKVANIIPGVTSRKKNAHQMFMQDATVSFLISKLL